MIALAAALAYPAYTTLACSLTDCVNKAVADAAAPAEKTKPVDKDCRKRAQRDSSGKPCPDGGERLPQDRRSPLDSLPPLAPLVA